MNTEKSKPKSMLARVSAAAGIVALSCAVAAAFFFWREARELAVDANALAGWDAMRLAAALERVDGAVGLTVVRDRPLATGRFPLAFLGGIKGPEVKVYPAADFAMPGTWPDKYRRKPGSVSPVRFGAAWICKTALPETGAEDEVRRVLLSLTGDLTVHDDCRFKATADGGDLYHGATRLYRRSYSKNNLWVDVGSGDEITEGRLAAGIAGGRR